MAEWYMEHTIAAVATPREPSLRLPPQRVPPEPAGLLDVSRLSSALFIMFEDTYDPILVKEEVVEDDVTPEWLLGSLGDSSCGKLYIKCLKHLTKNIC